MSSKETETEDFGASHGYAFISKAIEAGYSDDDAKIFYDDVVEHQAVNSVVDFLLRRPDCFKEGVVKLMNDALSPWTKNPNLIISNPSKPAIPQDPSANAGL